MNTAKIYYDSEGTERTINQMVRYEPEWAASVIQDYETKVKNLEQQNKELKETIGKLSETIASQDLYIKHLESNK